MAEGWGGRQGSEALEPDQAPGPAIFAPCSELPSEGTNGADFHPSISRDTSSIFLPVDIGLGEKRMVCSIVLRVNQA